MRQTNYNLLNKVSYLFDLINIGEAKKKDTVQDISIKYQQIVTFLAQYFIIWYDA
jgi:hypothetical protein